MKCFGGRVMKKENHTSAIRRIIGDVLIVLAILLTVDVIIVMTYRINAVVLKEDYQTVFKYQLILCAILLLFSFDIRFLFFTRSKRKPVRIIGWVVRILVILLTSVIVFFCVKVIGGCFINTSKRAEHAIVLGLALENGKPAKDLIFRLNKAQEYLEKNPEAELILTGGNADGSDRTEAAFMRELLLEKGIEDEQMIIEDQAESTRENFNNVANIIDPKEPVVLISSDYHMDRAVQTAEKAGLSNILRLPAPSSFLYFGANVMSEAVLELNELLFGE